jgi:hypothetical protein
VAEKDAAEWTITTLVIDLPLARWWCSGTAVPTSTAVSFVAVSYSEEVPAGVHAFLAAVLSCGR